MRSAEEHWSLRRVTEALDKAMSTSRHVWRDSMERQVAVRGSEGEGEEFADKGVSELGDLVDVTTGRGAEEGRDGGRTERAVMVGNKASKWERAQGKESSEG
jgi:hypothetical protein